MSYWKDIYDFLSEKHPNRKIYVISDHHFFHQNMLLYGRSEFQNVLEMNETIIQKHNEVITDQDIVLFLGDFSFKNQAMKDILARMKGHKYLLHGNHDAKSLIRFYYRVGFEGVFPYPVKINDLYLSHQPINSEDVSDFNFQLLFREFQKETGINYHGHIHANDKGQLPYCNVCCEALGYKPYFIGYTKEAVKNIQKPDIIDSDLFESLLLSLKNVKHLDSSLIVSDYIYAMMLEELSSYRDFYFAYGSYPLYKKYGFISNFSDLDIGLIYDEQLSKGKNIARLKEMADQVYQKVSKIYHLYPAFERRMNDLCIFEVLYTNRNGNLYKGYYDANLVMTNLYQDSDFIFRENKTTLEKMLEYEQNDLLQQFHFPKYQSKFLSINGDISNLVLQILFQKDFYEKKVLALKKLNYIYRTKGNKDMENVIPLEDVMTRFFLRNVLFLFQLRRERECENIHDGFIDISFLSELPLSLKKQLVEIMENPNSKFNRVYREFLSMPLEEFPKRTRELLKIER